MILSIKYIDVDAVEIIAAMPGLVIYKNKSGEIVTCSSDYLLTESQKEYTKRMSKMVAEQKEIY